MWTQAALQHCLFVAEDASVGEECCLTSMHFPLLSFLPYCYQISLSCSCPGMGACQPCNNFALNSCPLLQVSDFRLASAFTATAINGPPVQGGLPIFTWRRFNHTRHQGLPESYNFKFVTMRPIL